MSRKFKIIDYQVREEGIWSYIDFRYGHCFFVKKFPDGSRMYWKDQIFPDGERFI